MARLADLSPELRSVDRGGLTYQTLTFSCPLCRKGGLQVHVWKGKAGDVQIADGTVRLWHAEQGPHRDWATLSITPSIDGTNAPHKDFHGNVCPGWHGYITDGKTNP